MRSTICDEGRATTTRGERASDEDDEERDMATTSEYWGFFGLVLVFSFFFFFGDKHLCIGVCFAFALYRLYWGLVFSAFFANDVIVDLIFDSLCFFFFENLWVGLLPL